MEYEDLVQDIFKRFPSVQKEGFKPGAYKPGLEGMRDFDAVLGYPSRAIKTIHVAGTNGKGSVANMLASALSAAGYRTGLYTSPHLVDFRERARIDGEMIPRDYVKAFLEKWKPYFESENLSFFEITTGLAFRWFADSHVDVAVIECGLGGRLDSTNIITPVLSVITSIGLDHCSLLGSTLAEIAAEKAGIMKPGVPCVIGETHPQTAPVFDNYAAILQTQTSAKSCQATKTPQNVAADVRAVTPGHKNAAKRGPGVQLVYADQVEPPLWGRREEILAAMDLQAPVQRKNLRTVLCALDQVQPLLADQVQRGTGPRPTTCTGPGPKRCWTRSKSKAGVEEQFVYGIEHTARLMHFHGRWERLQEKPLVIADIGHNAHALESNFKALEAMNRPLIIVYGIMADKDLDSIIPLMPRKAKYIFVAPDTPRALPAERILARYNEIAGQAGNDARTAPSVKIGIKMAMEQADDNTVIYIGGSTFVVAEAL
jgi:dihydrofolate synthase/folylpolyglutamate synthase